MVSERYLRAYYHTFDPTGDDSIDAILEAVAMAGKAYHSTSDWSDADQYGPHGYWSLIQMRAEAAARVRAHPAPQPSGPVEAQDLTYLKDVMERAERHASDPNWEPERRSEFSQQAKMLRRILSALTSSKPEQECATEGCDKPATDYFERGGVGSHYCPDCHLKVQAVTTPPTAGGGDA